MAFQASHISHVLRSWPECASIEQSASETLAELIRDNLIITFSSIRNSAFCRLPGCWVGLGLAHKGQIWPLIPRGPYGQDPDGLWILEFDKVLSLTACLVARGTVPRSPIHNSIRSTP